MSTKSKKVNPTDPVVPLEIPVGIEDPTDLGSTGVGAYFNSVNNVYRIGITELDSSIKWATVGIVWDE